MSIIAHIIIFIIIAKIEGKQTKLGFYNHTQRKIEKKYNNYFDFSSTMRASLLLNVWSLIECELTDSVIFESFTWFDFFFCWFLEAYFFAIRCIHLFFFVFVFFLGFHIWQIAFQVDQKKSRSISWQLTIHNVYACVWLCVNKIQSHAWRREKEREREHENRCVISELIQI